MEHNDTLHQNPIEGVIFQYGSAHEIALKEDLLQNKIWKIMILHKDCGVIRLLKISLRMLMVRICFIVQIVSILIQ